jgi:chromosome partitioning protein
VKSYAFTLQKGGTGKTSISVSLAAELAKNFKVILLDCDPQGNATSWLESGDLHAELADYFLDHTPLQQIIIKTGVERLDLLPTAGLGGRLKMFAESIELGKNPFCIADALDAIGRLGYDYAVLDLSPSFGLFERNTVIACDEVITPIIPVNFAVDGLGIFADNIDTARKSLRVTKPIYKRIVINAIDNRLQQHADYTAQVEKQMTDFTIYKIKVDPIFPKAQDKKLVIQQMTGTKKETLDTIAQLAADIIGA